MILIADLLGRAYCSAAGPAMGCGL